MLKLLKEGLGRPLDKLRLLCIYVLNYGLPDADFNLALKLLERKEEKEVLKIIR